MLTLFSAGTVGAYQGNPVEQTNPYVPCLLSYLTLDPTVRFLSPTLLTCCVTVPRTCRNLDYRLMGPHEGNPIGKHLFGLTLPAGLTVDTRAQSLAHVRPWFQYGSLNTIMVSPSFGGPAFCLFSIPISSTILCCGGFRRRPPRSAVPFVLFDL